MTAFFLKKIFTFIQVLLTLLKNNRKALLFLMLGLLSLSPAQSQITAYNSNAVFNIPGKQAYIETYLTLVGYNLKAKKNNGSYNNSVNIVFKLYKDTSLVKVNKYNLNGPAFTDSLVAPTFIDIQRYTVGPGNYYLRFSISDNYNPSQKPLVISQDLAVTLTNGQLQFSSIELLESYKRNLGPGNLSKSGIDMVPYTVNYFPETSRELIFYTELYNANQALGQNQAFLLSYFLETSKDQQRLNSYSSFKKQEAQAVNPLLAKLDISKLGTGDYNLVIEARNDKNEVVQRQKFFFQRLNRAVDIASLQKYSVAYDMAPYFGKCNNADTLKMYVECLWPIADGLDKERIINQGLKKDPELMKNFVVDFWRRRAADTANPVKLWTDYYKNVQQVMLLFKCGRQPGYYTERGRVYLQYGPPNQRSQQPNEPNTYPYEIWQYYRITNATNGQFFSNRKFVFVSKMLGDDCYKLVHSDMLGEVNNQRWQFELMRNANSASTNLDNTVPAGTQNNQFNEIYNNPR